MFAGYTKHELNIKDASRLDIEYEPANVDEGGVEFEIQFARIATVSGLKGPAMIGKSVQRNASA